MSVFISIKCCSSDGYIVDQVDDFFESFVDVRDLQDIEGWQILLLCGKPLFEARVSSEMVCMYVRDEGMKIWRDSLPLVHDLRR